MISYPIIVSQLNCFNKICQTFVNYVFLLLQKGSLKMKLKIVGFHLAVYFISCVRVILVSNLFLIVKAHNYHE